VKEKDFIARRRASKSFFRATEYHAAGLRSTRSLGAWEPLPRAGTAGVPAGGGPRIQ